MQVELDHYQRGAAATTALVNTAAEVMTSTGDVLTDPESLRRLLLDHELIRTPSPADVVDVRALRSTLRAAIDDPATVAEAMGALVAAVGTGPTLRRDDGGRWAWWVSTAPGAALVDELALLTALGVLGVLRALGPDRFRSCANPACQGAFVDVSRAGRRRYCVPDVCGNRVNVANHRARQRADPAPPTR